MVAYVAHLQRCPEVVMLNFGFKSAKSATPPLICLLMIFSMSDTDSEFREYVKVAEPYVNYVTKGSRVITATQTVFIMLCVFAPTCFQLVIQKSSFSQFLTLRE